MVRRFPRGRALTLLWGVGLAALVIPLAPAAASPTAPTSVAAGPAGAGVSPSSVTAASNPIVGSFASRAGFSSAYSTDVPNSVPAQGNVPVVVTFDPRNSTTFFATPPSGSAPLTTSEIAARFGLSPGQYSTVEAYFRSQGLSVVRTWPDRLSLDLEGSAASVGGAFGTQLREGTFNGASVLYPSEPPVLPGSIEPLVGSVLGLSSGFDTFVSSSLSSSAPIGATPAQGSSVVYPSIARDIYDLSGLYNVSGSFHPATGESIALLLWGDGYSTSDIQTFFSDYYPSSFPAPAVDPYPVDGAPGPSTPPVDNTCPGSEEMTLDIEWSGSMAPGATLDAVYAPFGTGGSCASPTDASMADALHTAVDLPVSAISMSFGTNDSSSGSLAAAWGTYLAEAVQKGITLLAATGDLGGAGESGCQGGPAPQYPSTSPDVLAVGGTDVALASSGLLGGISFSETAWSDSGGGYSTQYSAPSWQTGTTMRATPDVAATADGNFLYYDGQPMEADGTSFATPLWAGLITEMDSLYGQPFGLIAPRLYAVGNAESAPGSHTLTGLAPITSGSNCFYSAGPGWNAVTGWGSPRALDLYEDLTATFVNLSISASPRTVAQGASVTVSGHLANVTTGAAIAGVPIQVSLASVGSLGPCTGTFGSATAPTNAYGNVSVSVSVPTCYFGSHATADVEVTADGYYGTNSTTVSVNLFGLIPSLAYLGEYPTSIATFVAIVVAASLVGYVLGRGPRPSVRAGPPPVPSAAPPAGAVGPSAPSPAVDGGPPTPSVAAGPPEPGAGSGDSQTR